MRYGFMAGCGIVLILIGVFTSLIAVIAGLLLLLGAGVGIGAERRA
jgi:hypothetical protein